MKLYKALKDKKNLIGDINKLKSQIKEHNSHMIGSKNGENFDVIKKYDELYNKINKLVALKYIINEANREIQSKIYLIGEYKALIVFWNEVSTKEGLHSVDYGDKIREYAVHIDQNKKNEYIEKYQAKIDALQDEIDIFNHTTEVPWD